MNKFKQDSGHAHQRSLVGGLGLEPGVNVQKEARARAGAGDPCTVGGVVYHR